MNAHTMMRAAVATAYDGPEVVRVVDVPRPDPGPGQVRIRVEATTVSAGDRRIRALDVPGGLRTLTRLALGWSRPRQPILGTELTGRIDALGPGVSGLRAGDAVVGMRGASLGGHAEYIVVPAAEKLIPRPAGLTVGEAAAFCFGGLAALHYVATAGGVRAGEHVLVNGASGAVGSAAGLYRPVIDSTHSLDAIAAAHARADTGRKRGSVVVTLE